MLINPNWSNKPALWVRLIQLLILESIIGFVLCQGQGQQLGPPPPGGTFPQFQQQRQGPQFQPGTFPSSFPQGQPSPFPTQTLPSSFPQGQPSPFPTQTFPLNPQSPGSLLFQPGQIPPFQQGQFPSFQQGQRPQNQPGQGPPSQPGPGTQFQPGTFPSFQQGPNQRFQQGQPFGPQLPGDLSQAQPNVLQSLSQTLPPGFSNGSSFVDPSTPLAPIQLSAIVNLGSQVNTESLSMLRVWQIVSQFLPTISSKSHNYILSIQPQLIKGIPTFNMSLALRPPLNPQILKSLVSESSGMLPSQRATISGKLISRLDDPNVFTMILGTDNPGELMSFFPPRLLQKDMSAFIRSLTDFTASRTEVNLMKVRLLPTSFLSSLLRTLLGDEPLSVQSLRSRNFGRDLASLALMGVNCNQIQALRHEDVVPFVGMLRDQFHANRKEIPNLNFPINVRNCALDALLLYLATKDGDVGSNVLGRLDMNEIGPIGGEIFSGVPFEGLENLPVDIRREILIEIGHLKTFDLLHLIPVGTLGRYGSLLLNDLSTMTSQTFMSTVVDTQSLAKMGSLFCYADILKGNFSKDAVRHLLESKVFPGSKTCCFDSFGQTQWATTLKKVFGSDVSQWKSEDLVVMGDMLVALSEEDVAKLSVPEIGRVITPLLQSSGLNFPVNFRGKTEPITFARACVTLLQSPSEYKASFKALMRKYVLGAEIMVNFVQKAQNRLNARRVAREVPTSERNFVGGEPTNECFRDRFVDASCEEGTSTFNFERHRRQSPMPPGAAPGQMLPTTMASQLGRAPPKLVQQQPPTQFQRPPQMPPPQFQQPPQVAPPSQFNQPPPFRTPQPPQMAAPPQSQLPPQMAAPPQFQLPPQMESPSQFQQPPQMAAPPQFQQPPQMAPPQFQQPPQMPQVQSTRPAQQQLPGNPQNLPPPPQVQMPPNPQIQARSLQSQFPPQQQAPPSPQMRPNMPTFQGQMNTQPPIGMSNQPFQNQRFQILPQFQGQGQRTSQQGQQFPQQGQQFPQGSQQFPQGSQQFPQGSQQFPQGGQQFPQGSQQFPTSQGRQNSQNGAQVPPSTFRNITTKSGPPKRTDERTRSLTENQEIKLTCLGIKAAGPAAIGLLTSDFTSLDPSELRDCIEAIGFVDWSESSKLELLQVYKDKLNLTSKLLTTVNLIELGNLVTALSISGHGNTENGLFSSSDLVGGQGNLFPFDISAIDLSVPVNLDSISILGSQITDADVLKVIGDKFTLDNNLVTSRVGKSRESFVRTTVWSLGNILCGLDDTVLKIIFDSIPAEFVDVSPTLGRLQGCGPRTLSLLAQYAVQSTNYGSPDKWTMEDVDTLGVVVAGLAPEAFVSISPEALEGLHPLAVHQMSAIQIQSLTPFQLGNLSYEAATQVFANSKLFSVLSTDQIQGLRNSISVNADHFKIPVPAPNPEGPIVDLGVRSIEGGEHEHRNSSTKNGTHVGNNTSMSSGPIPDEADIEIIVAEPDAGVNPQGDLVTRHTQHPTQPPTTTSTTSTTKPVSETEGAADATTSDGQKLIINSLHFLFLFLSNVIFQSLFRWK